MDDHPQTIDDMMLGLNRIHPWCVLDGHETDDRNSGSRHFQRLTRWSIFEPETHTHWAHIASFSIAATPQVPGEVQRDVPRRSADANLTLDIGQLWLFCGLSPDVPLLDDTGRIQVLEAYFPLKQPLIAIGRGITTQKALTQVVRSEHSVGRCQDACGACPYCHFSLFTVCARDSYCCERPRVAVRFTRDPPLPHAASGTEETVSITMDFYARPSLSLIDNSYRVFNSFTYLVGGVYRNAQRSGFSTESAITSMRATDNDSSLQAFVDRVLAEGWHSHIQSKLQALGVDTPPYPHQSAAILAMLEMEKRLDQTGFTHAPRFGRRGFGGFLDASFVPLTAGSVICALTGSVLSRSHADTLVRDARGGVLALPPGVGKTYTCVALCLLAWTPGKYAAIIECPAHLSLQWKSEITRYAPSARVVSEHDASISLVDVPTFLVAPQAPSVHDAVQSAAAGAAHPSRNCSADRYIVDEAHSAAVPYPERRPGRDEAVWAVTATPFFARTARAASLFETLQKIPRHFGVPTVHAQVARILRRDVGIVFREFVLNLHDLAHLLPVVSSSEVTIRLREPVRNTSLRTKVADLLPTMSSMLSQRMLDSVTRAAALGLVLHPHDLDPRQQSQRRQPQRATFPAWQDISSTPHGEAATANTYGGDDCVICLSCLEEGAAIALPCGHQFHYDCMRQWHEQPADRSRCPTCRSAYGVHDVLRRSGEPVGATHEQGPTGANQWDFAEVHERCVDIVLDHLARAEGKVIVFLPQAAAARLSPHLRRANASFVSCIDAAGPVRRAEAIQEFVEGSVAKVLLIDPLSFETGLNLTAANLVISYPYHRGSIEQMAGRVRRLGQKHAVRFVQLKVDVTDILP